MMLPIRERMRGLAAERRRFGYRRLHWLLGREGVAINHKKFRRLYREEQLQLRRRGGRKRALGTRAPMAIPQVRNQRWSLDFVSDAFACGRRFRIFAVIDDFTRECVQLIADTSISGLRVARELDWATAEPARPRPPPPGSFTDQPRRRLHPLVRRDRSGRRPSPRQQTQSNTSGQVGQV